jgi:hypothetical protein
MLWQPMHIATFVDPAFASCATAAVLTVIEAAARRAASVAREDVFMAGCVVLVGAKRRIIGGPLY